MLVTVICVYLSVNGYDWVSSADISALAAAVSLEGDVVVCVCEALCVEVLVVEEPAISGCVPVGL